MHPEPYEFVKDLKIKFPDYFSRKKVLEVGSLDINGSIRSFFEYCDYLGIDLGEGKGVDMIIPVHRLDHLDTYDVVISTEMLEHDRYWEKSLRRMYDNLKSGGMLILTTAGPERQEHGTTRTIASDSPFTTDYYRNISIEDFQSILPPILFKVYDIRYERGQADLLFYGIKK